MLAVAMGSNSECCYSGGADARIHSWKIPDLNMDPYDGYGEDSSLPPPCPWESPHSFSPRRCLTVRPRPGGAGSGMFSMGWGRTG